MEAGRCRGALALASPEMHGLCGHLSKICASVSPPVFGDWFCPMAVCLKTKKKTQRFLDFSGKALAKCNHHGKELKMLIFKEI